jgi:hypothetical protein
MKTIIGIGLIILGIVSLTRYPNLGVSLPETLGVLMVFAIIVIPGILLIRSDLKKSNKN